MELNFAIANPFNEPNSRLGSFVLESGHVVHLCQQAYMDGTNENPIYRASGYLASENPDDETGPTVTVTWACENYEAENEEDCCDWDNPESIVHYSLGEFD